ncbi:unnamed protein product [Linum tenue]|uniref:Cytochrome P450 n=1 Tax=Linum tenue TaxID=586396 RepID=A0AAV0M3M7_9ROSI|nr:unnamed protein product [Linum tenue]
MELLPELCIPFLLAVTVILLATSWFISKKQSKPRTASNRLPPGPWKLPIIGNLHQLIISSEPAHRRLRELSRKYGPVMQLQLGELHHVVVSSAEAARDVLKTHDAALASRPYVLAADVIFYGQKGIAFTPYGAYWRQMRKICMMELLSDRRVLSYRSVREDELSCNMVRRIFLSSQKKMTTDDHRVNLGEILFWASNRVIAMSAFGAIRENTESFMAVVNSISDVLGGMTVSDLYPSVKFLPTLTGFRSKLNRLHRAADVLLDEIINEHVAKRRREHKGDNILDVLLDLQESATTECPLTSENIKAIASDLLLGASGTSTITIEWTMAELMRNPRVMKKVQEEIRQAFRGGGRVDEARIEELKYTNAVIKEALRMHPDGPLLGPRESQVDVVVDGYLVPARTKVIVNAWAIGRDPQFWDDAETFHPERFLDCSVDYRGTDFQFVPFGAGRRMCPGLAFGMATVKLGLTNLLYHFDWKLPDGMKPEELDMTETFGLTLRRKNPLCLIPVAYNPVA